MSQSAYDQTIGLLDHLSPAERIQVMQTLVEQIGSDAQGGLLKDKQAHRIRSLGRELLRQGVSAQPSEDRAPSNSQLAGLAPAPSPVVVSSPTDEDSLLAQSNLTRAQFSMWMGQQIYPDVPLYYVADAFQIHGPLDLPALRRAFAALVAHTDVLRTLIVTEDGVPNQHVLDDLNIEFEYIDQSGEIDPQAAYAAWLAEQDDSRLAFDRQLFYAALIKLRPDAYVWYQGLHHAITDATSSDLLFQRLADYYRAALENRLDQQPTPPQYQDFVQVEQEMRGTARYQQAAAYWQEKCTAGVPPMEFYGNLPVDSALHAERVVYPLGAKRSTQLSKLAQAGGFASPSQDLSTFSVFATALLATLQRLNHQDIHHIGTLYNGRHTAAFQETLGLFIEMGILQVPMEADDTFVSLGQKVMSEALDNLSHILPGITGAEVNRAVDVVLNFVQPGSPDFDGLRVDRKPVHSGYIDAEHSLRLWVTDYDASGEFTLIFDMKSAVFGEAERTRFVEHFVRVIDALIANPRRALGSFFLLSPQEHQTLVVDFNRTDADYPDATVVSLFEKQAARDPGNVAAVQGSKSISYAALNRRANQLARHLRSLDIGPEATVALCMDRSIDVLVACWGVLKAGGAFVPIDPAYPADRIAFMIDDAGCALALTGDSDLAAMLAGRADMRVLSLSDLDLSNYDMADLQFTIALDSLAYMIYTSGSTGKPKGVMLTHQGLLNYVWWARRVYQQEGALDFPLYSSLAFDLTITSLFVPLLSGGRIVVYGESTNTAGLEILDVFRDDAVDIVKLTPSHLALVSQFDLSQMRIRKLIVGGEDFKTELARSIHDAFGGRVEIYNEYGPTEAVVGCMIHRYDPEQDRAPSVPIGTPAANARIYLLDAYDQPVPPGLVGEMVISSDGVARGYHGRPTLTAERFGADPFRPGARIYRTGDIARWTDDREMVFLGRRDHQVKVGGARIELGEIESRLAEHPAIQDAVVVATQLTPGALDSQVAHCALCGLPSNFPDVTFDDEGVCNLCRDFDTFRDDVFRYFRTMDDLHVIVDRAKAERMDDYDCMMLYSGGKDSTYVLGQLVEMGLKVLAFSLDNGYISDEAKENIRQVTDYLGVDLVFGTTPHMNAIFVDSLERFSNVCQGCYKTIYTLSMQLARKKGIKYIFTGLSRGQLFETRLDELFRNRIFDVEGMDRAVTEARKVYHRVDDAVSDLLDVSMFDDDRVFDEIQFVDFFRYTEVELDEIYAFLSTGVPWRRPDDTGRSTNCLINEAGIYVHRNEQGYHNYAHPYSWDVRLGHKTRDEALEELDDDLRLPMVSDMLAEVGYQPKHLQANVQESRLAAYYVANGEAVDASTLRVFLAETLPSHMAPSYFVALDELPLTPNGKVDRAALPSPTEETLDSSAAYRAPESEIEVHLATVWSQTLGIKQIGVDDNFFDLGGASILAVQIVTQVSNTFDVPFTVRHFFEHPTIATQSAILNDLLDAQLASLSDEEIEALLREMDD